MHILWNNPLHLFYTISRTAHNCQGSGRLTGSVPFSTSTFNDRLGNKQDCIFDIDNAPEKSILDKATNKHGDALYEFY